ESNEAESSAPETDSVQWVLGAGTPGWRKGTDRLAAVAHALQRVSSPAQVGWVGGRPTGADASAVGRTDLVNWIPESADPWKLLSHAAVFVLPSREDPLPLVALEAGLYRRAVVAMPTGGLPDLLADGRGLVGSRQDVRWFVAAVEQVLASRALAEDLGQRLHEFVRTHHDVDVIAPRWLRAVSDAAGR
ncbi:MAG: glycosyltransferase, partial [Actinobacteria bacterium]|nr:glycosyltransferase [Actinomycetota bacterium]